MATGDHTAAAAPCRTCPWLNANHRRRHPDAWFTGANRRLLWAGLRDGQSMSCHRTDPANPVSDEAVLAGFPRVPAGTVPRECAGALILVQRELQLLNDIGDVKGYQKQRRGGLTRRGIVVYLERYLFGGVLGTLGMSRPDLNAPVGHGGSRLPWTPRLKEQP